MRRERCCRYCILLHMAAGFRDNAKPQFIILFTLSNVLKLCENSQQDTLSVLGYRYYYFFL